jgi:uncharacterized membrane protein HdeD (DUF308 family)
MSNNSNANPTLKQLGIVMIVLGLFCTIFAPLVSAAIAMVIGITLTIGGAFYFYHTFIGQLGGNKLLNILFSILTLWAGLFMVFHPMLGIMTLVQITMIYFLVGGVFEVINSFQMRSRKDWWVSGILGALNIIFAVILISRADIGAWLLGFLIGINLTLKGSFLLILSSKD